VTHPSLGLPPPDSAAGFPAAADALLAARSRLAARAIEATLAADPTLGERHDAVALRNLRRDAGAVLEMVAKCLATGDLELARRWAEQVVPVLRRRAVPMDDLVAVANAIRSVVDAALPADAFSLASAALDAAIDVFRWHRRIGGDARRRNRLLAFLYKGA
jgi:hypothetical protein